MKIDKPLTTHVALMIRRPAADCYEAFVEPAVTSKFWFSDGSDRLDATKVVTWTWAMYGLSSKVMVKELRPEKKIVVEWDHGTDEATTVTWTFTDRGDGTTMVDVKQTGFSGAPDEQLVKLADTTSGFALVLAGAKAWLEHGVRLRVVEDVHPDNHVEGWIES